MKLKRIESLNSLRFFMIINIMVSHLEFFARTNVAGFYEKYLHNAVIGVDFFFIMSGFGMIYSFMKKQSEIQVGIKYSIQFAVYKVKKIYFVYVSSLIICIPYLLYYYHIHENIKIAIKLISIKFIACLTLLQSATGMFSISNGINSVSWFLSSIFIIYLFVPYIGKVLLKMSNKIKTILISIFVTAAILELAYYVFFRIESRTMFDNLTYGSPYVRIWYVIIGMLLGKLYFIIQESGKLLLLKKTFWNFLESSSLLLTLIWFLMRNSVSFSIYSCYILDIFICGFMVLAFSFEKGFISDILQNEKINELGKASMYLFLIHYPVRLYMDLLFSKTILAYSTLGCCIETILIFSISLWISLTLLRKNVICE